MSIRHWHWGKIALVWIAVLIVEALFFDLIYDGLWRQIGRVPSDDERFIAGIVFVAPPSAAIILTWLWLSSQEK